MPVAVKTEAVQDVNGESVVFVAVQGGFVPQPVKVGRTKRQGHRDCRGPEAGRTLRRRQQFCSEGRTWQIQRRTRPLIRGKQQCLNVSLVSPSSSDGWSCSPCLEWPG
nr:hypothetical protein [Cupriavidus oxalaticus]